MEQRAIHSASRINAYPTSTQQCKWKTEGVISYLLLMCFGYKKSISWERGSAKRMADIRDDSGKRVRNDVSALETIVLRELCAHRVGFGQGEEKEAIASQMERLQLE